LTYHMLVYKPMRLFVFILMIALLPLRGWVGEAMATDMAAMNIIAAQAANTLANAENEVMSADCEMHARGQSETSKSGTSCTHCQVCHAAGMVSTVQINSEVQADDLLVSTHVQLLASAHVALSQKPPIL
jgi:hypothetical protein